MPKRIASNSARVENQEGLRTLLEKYGRLLTEHQRAMVQSYAVDGKNFSEIARQYSVSRQAVHETVRTAERVLSDYETKLGDSTGNTGVQPAEIREVVNKLESLKLKIARTGIIYSVDWIRREIDTVMGILQDPSQSLPQIEENDDNEPVIITTKES